MGGGFVRKTPEREPAILRRGFSAMQLSMPLRVAILIISMLPFFGIEHLKPPERVIHVINEGY